MPRQLQKNSFGTRMRAWGGVEPSVREGEKLAPVMGGIKVRLG